MFGKAGHAREWKMGGGQKAGVKEDDENFDDVESNRPNYCAYGAAKHEERGKRKRKQKQSKAQWCEK